VENLDRKNIEEMDPKEHLALAKAIPGEDKRGGKSRGWIQFCALSTSFQFR